VSLSEITIPDTVTSIGNSAFEGCVGLQSVSLGTSLTSIGDAAFSGCTSLKCVVTQYDPDSCFVASNAYEDCPPDSCFVASNAYEDCPLTGCVDPTSGGGGSSSTGSTIVPVVGGVVGAIVTVILLCAGYRYRCGLSWLLAKRASRAEGEEGGGLDLSRYNLPRVSALRAGHSHLQDDDDDADVTPPPLADADDGGAMNLAVLFTTEPAMPMLGETTSRTLVVTSFVNTDFSQGSIGAMADYWPEGSMGSQSHPVFVKIGRDKAALKREYEILRMVRYNDTALYRCTSLMSVHGAIVLAACALCSDRGVEVSPYAHTYL
jgi:hypothetical protein